MKVHIKLDAEVSIEGMIEIVRVLEKSAFQLEIVMKEVQ